MSLGLYLHIPYCFSKCRYCDFYSHPGERGVPEAYVDALVRELSRFAPEAPLQPDTLYFGGGTPSLLRPEQAKQLIDAARPMPGAEITLEANPETVTEESLAGFREAGVNRISFGVQSARDTQLRTLGRPHTAKQARAAFAAARRAGFANISGDIMLALPHYTEAEFDETLELIEGGGATHISAYLLKIEPDSAFGKHPPEGLPTGDEAADFYLYAVEQLEHHGYKQYEISNFAKPGYEADTTSFTGTAATIWPWPGGALLHGRQTVLLPAGHRRFPERCRRPGDGRQLRRRGLPYFTAASAQRPFAGCIQKTLRKRIFHRTAGLCAKLRPGGLCKL